MKNNMTKAQIAVEHLLLVTLAILIIVPSILVYQNYIAHDPTKDNVMAAKLANDITDEVSTMIRLGSGWQTFTFDAPESIKSIDARGNELLVRLADGSHQVAFLPQGTIASAETGGINVAPGKNRLKITYKHGVFCFSSLQGECTPCVDNDGDAHYWSPQGHEACPGKLWDCDDVVPWAYEDATSLCDGIDTNCDGSIDGDWDADGDGFYGCEYRHDCYDNRSELFEQFNGEFDTDFWNRILNYPKGTYCKGLGVDPNNWYLCCDCDDAHVDVYPGAPEQCNDIDHDCSQQLLEQFDVYSLHISCEDEQDEFDHNVVFYRIEDETIYCEQLKKSCKDLYPPGTSCYQYDNDALCEGVNGEYGWHGCGYVEETGDKCFDGIDNDCDGLIDWQDPNCYEQTIFYIGFEDGFNRENCGRDACTPEIAEMLEIVEGAGLRNSKAMKVLEPTAQFQYAIDDIPPSSEGSIFFFVKGNSDIWNNHEKIVLFEAIVEEDKYLQILHEDSKLKAVINKGAANQSVSSDVSLGNDWHLIAFTYKYQGSNPVSNGRLFLDGDLLNRFNSFQMGLAWSAQTSDVFLSMHLGTGTAELSGTGLLFDDFFIISGQVDDGYITTVYEAMLCEELAPCNFLKGDINDDGCIDIEDISLIEQAIAGTIPKTSCMDMNTDCRVNADDLTLALAARTGCKYPGSPTCFASEACITGAKPWYCSADYELIASCAQPAECGCPGTETCNNNICSGGSSPIMAKITIPIEHGGPGWGGGGP